MVFSGLGCRVSGLGRIGVALYPKANAAHSEAGAMLCLTVYTVLFLFVCSICSEIVVRDPSSKADAKTQKERAIKKPL